MADNTKLQYIIELLTTGDTKKATEELTKLQAAGTVDVWHDALDHIRLSTLSPLKFAAE